MQIGSRGRAYGPSNVMSRPTLGRAIRSVPGGPRVGSAISAALNRMPEPPPFNPQVLLNELHRRTDAGSVARELPYSVHPSVQRAALAHVRALIDSGQLESETDPRFVGGAAGHHGGGMYLQPTQFGAHVPHILVPIHPSGPPPQIVHLPLPMQPAPPQYPATQTHPMVPASWPGITQTPSAPTTVDPGALLARARLAMLIRQTGAGATGGGA